MQRGEWDLPEPPGVQGPQRTFPWGWIVLLLALPVVVIASIYVPVPIFYSYLPGPVRDIQRFVQVDGSRTYSSEGHLLMTTVTIDTEVTLWDVLSSAVDADKELVFKSSVTGGQSLRQELKEQRQQMRISKRHAQEVVLAALGLGQPGGDGARVIQTVPGYPAEGILRAGDVILSVDGEKVETTCDVGEAIDRHEPGERVRITVRRGDSVRTFTVGTASTEIDRSAPFVGIAMEDVNYRFDPGLAVDFETGKIAGPSAGLMMSLALYDRLTPEDLTKGRSIAGTGTIACDGGVGPIGGVSQKVAGAEAQGAEIFLSPAANLQEAKAAADDIRVVAVSNFNDAVTYLEGLPASASDV